MRSLVEVYSNIDGAEQQSRKGDFVEAINEYKKALKNLGKGGNDSAEQNNNLSEDVARALGLLQQDIEAKIRELESFVELRKPTKSKNSYITGSLWNTASPPTQGMAKTRSLEGSLNGANSRTGLIMDPLLASLLAKLQANLMSTVNDELSEVKGYDAQNIESQLDQQFSRFKKELSIYEQKKVKEHNLRLDQAIKENKKLSNQIVKLKERWDSLVESAKQRRNKKQDE